MPTLRRRNPESRAAGSDPLRSSLASAAWAVEDRVVWGTADVLRGLPDVVKWPFERIAWAVEHWLLWPIQEETALWSKPVRAAALAGVVVLAAAGIAAGVAISKPSGGSDTAAVEAVAPPSTAPTAPAVHTSPVEAAKKAPVLHGAAPRFAPESGGGVSKSAAAETAPAQAQAKGAAAGAGATTTSSSSSKASPPAAITSLNGPAAIKVARSFSQAFVLYEIGRADAKVRSTFAKTATPDLAHSLLQRPPRLPANVKVPKAKVLNIVPGPNNGELSVSLLRVGLTSELRITMQEGKGGPQVGHILG